MPDIDAEALTWEPPPPVVRGKRSSKYDPIVDKLKENPGNWTQVLWDVNSASARVFINKGCEITTRSTGDGSGRVNVWAMYPGDTVPDTEDTPSVPKTAAKKTAAKKAPASRPRARSKTKTSS